MQDPFENVDDPNEMYTASERQAILERAKSARSSDIAHSIMSHSLIRSINEASAPEPPTAPSVAAQAEPSPTPTSTPTETVPSLPQSLPGRGSGSGSFLQETGAVDRPKQKRRLPVGWTPANLAAAVALIAAIVFALLWAGVGR